MAAEPIRFRCFQCQKLLGVSPSKVGAIVACPSCGMELIVPELPAVSPAQNESKPRSASAGKSDSSPAIATAQADQPGEHSFQPRSPKTNRGSAVEPAIVAWDSAGSPSSDSHATEAAAFPELQIAEPSSLRGDPHRRRRSERPEPVAPLETDRPAISGFPPPEFRDSSADFISTAGNGGESEESVSPPLVFAQASEEFAAPLIRPEPTPSLIERGSVGRRSDVVLPRSVVALWSFLVLLAVAGAFTTGLLIGKFVWAPGVAVGSAAKRT